MGIPLHLSVGELIGRANRFIFCPATGQIGLIEDFRGIPCFFTPADHTKKRTTLGTVEAISLNHGIDCIGMNQNRINGWIECLLQKNAFPDMINTEGCSVHREIKIDDSPIDLVVKKGEQCTFLELKTPIHDLLLSPGDHFRGPRRAPFSIAVYATFKRSPTFHRPATAPSSGYVLCTTRSHFPHPNGISGMRKLSILSVNQMSLASKIGNST
jgi:hypothetical protein